MVVLTGIFVLGGVFSCGYALGFLKGYDQCEVDDKQIKTEMNGFWKEVEQHGTRNHPVVRISSTKF